MQPVPIIINEISRKKDYADSGHGENVDKFPLSPNQVKKMSKNLYPSICIHTLTISVPRP